MIRRLEALAQPPNCECICPDWTKGSYIKEPFIWKRGTSSQELVGVMEVEIQFHMFGSHMTSICQSFIQMGPEIFRHRFIWNKIRSYVNCLMMVWPEGKCDVYWLVIIHYWGIFFIEWSSHVQHPKPFGGHWWQLCNLQMKRGEQRRLRKWQ